MQPPIIWNIHMTPGFKLDPSIVYHGQHEFPRLIGVVGHQGHAVVVPVAGLDQFEDGSALTCGQTVAVEPGQDGQALHGQGGGQIQKLKKLIREYSTVGVTRPGFFW